MCPISGYFDTVFAIDGDLTAIPDPVQGSGTVSYTQGFGNLYSTPVASGGYNFPRAQFNQLMNDITTAIQVYQQFGTPPFITSVMNGGSPFSYAAGARVLYSGVVYTSLVGSNTDTPPSSKWIANNLSPRIRLLSNASYYVATSGNDSNLGTIGSPWLTIQHAINYISTTIDLAGYSATINVADGTYTTPVVLSQPFVGGTVSLIGDVTTPASCIISTTSNHCIYLASGTQLSISGFKLQTTTSGNCIFVNGSAQATINGNMNYGVCAGSHLVAQAGGLIQQQSNYTISGGANSHFNANDIGNIIVSSPTITLTGTPAFTDFAIATGPSVIGCTTGITTFSGSATGQRYNSSFGAFIQTQGGGANYFPGNTAGSSSTGYYN